MPRNVLDGHDIFSDTLCHDVERDIRDLLAFNIVEFICDSGVFLSGFPLGPRGYPGIRCAHEFMSVTGVFLPGSAKKRRSNCIQHCVIHL